MSSALPPKAVVAADIGGWLKSAKAGHCVLYLYHSTSRLTHTKSCYIEGHVILR
jgi:hypothetical protein